jgi:hypothetical protein
MRVRDASSSNPHPALRATLSPRERDRSQTGCLNPGALAYGATSEQAKAKAHAIALRVHIDQLEHGEATGDLRG